MDMLTINASTLRTGDIIWIHGAYWEVRDVNQAAATATVERLRRTPAPSERGRRRLRLDDPVYRILYRAVPSCA